MPTGSIAPFPKHQFFDANGDPLDGAKLFVYSAGTATKVNSFTDSALSVANANPIVLDSAGRCTIFLTPGVSYKFVLAPSTDTDPPAAPYWTVDNVAAVPETAADLDVTGTAGEAITAADFVYCADGAGGTTAGRWYKTDADAVGTSNSAVAVGFAPSAITSGSSGSIRLAGRATGLAGLSTGSWYYLSGTAGAVTAVAPANARAVGFADSASSLILTPHGPTATAVLPGIVSTGTQAFAGAKTFDALTTFGLGAQSNIPLTHRAPGGSSYLGIPARLTSSYTATGNVGGGEDTLFTYAMPAGTLDSAGKSIRLLAWGTTANNANVKTIRFYFGTTLLMTAAPTVSEAGHWIAGARVIRSGAATQTAAAAFSSGPASAAVTYSVGEVTAPNQTLANAVTVLITGEATADNDVVCNGVSVQLEN